MTSQERYRSALMSWNNINYDAPRTHQHAKIRSKTRAFPQQKFTTHTNINVEARHRCSNISAILIYSVL